MMESIRALYLQKGRLVMALSSANWNHHSP